MVAQIELLSVTHRDYDRSLSLEVFQRSGNRLFVRVCQDGKPLGEKVFRDSETQHYDSERWLNDRVGYPNPFAGILSQQQWEKL